jgi:hydroxyacylglutathione hydrolase
MIKFAAAGYYTITHGHWDHIDGINDYRALLAGYPAVSFICHTSALEMSPKLESCFNIVFTGEMYETDIEGEPLILMSAPKHSSSDVMIVYRGTMITGDWWLGWGDPNVNTILAETSIKSIDRIINFLKRRNYIVRRLFSVHANDFRYDVDAESILLETRRYHETQLIPGK